MHVTEVLRLQPIGLPPKNDDCPFHNRILCEKLIQYRVFSECCLSHAGVFADGLLTSISQGWTLTGISFGMCPDSGCMALEKIVVTTSLDRAFDSVTKKGTHRRWGTRNPRDCVDRR
jgi:hypothetical protein